MRGEPKVPSYLLLLGCRLLGFIRAFIATTATVKLMEKGWILSYRNTALKLGCLQSRRCPAMRYASEESSAVICGGVVDGGRALLLEVYFPAPNRRIDEHLNPSINLCLGW